MMEEFLASVLVAILEVIMAAILVAVLAAIWEAIVYGPVPSEVPYSLRTLSIKSYITSKFSISNLVKTQGFPHPTTQTSVCTSGHSYPKACGDGARDIAVLICGAKTIFVPLLLLIDKLANFLLIFS